MKINFKKSIIMGLGIASICFAPVKAYAADFNITKDEENTSQNVTTLVVALDVAEGETITNAQFKCDTANTDIKCEIKAISGSGVSSAEGNSYTAFKYVDDEFFPEGSTKLAKLVITNSLSSKESVTISLKNASIDGETPSTTSISTTVGAKVEEKKLSNDASLKSVSFSQGTITPEFVSTTTDYTVYNIADTINSIRASIVCSEENTCDYSIEGGKSVSGNTITLNQGENTVKIYVTSEDGMSSKTYAFKIIRGETSFNSAKLASLSFGEYNLTPSFSKDVKEYTLRIPNKITTLQNVIEYKTEDSNASAALDGIDNLLVGENTLTITVDNQTGEETITYKITVTRLGAGEIEVVGYKDSKVTYLDEEGIKVTVEEKEFEKNYPEEMKKIKNGEYEFDENGDLKVEEVETTEKDKEDNSTVVKKDNKVFIIVGLIVGGLIIIVVSGILIFKKKDPKKEETEEKTENTEEEKSEEISEEDVTEEEALEEVKEDFEKDEDATVDIDEALSDLMSTKTYDFKKRTDEEKEDEE